MDLDLDDMGDLVVSSASGLEVARFDRDNVLDLLLEHPFWQSVANIYEPDSIQLVRRGRINKVKLKNLSKGRGV